jgi:hypothetical protein
MTTSGTATWTPGIPRFAYVHCKPDGTVFYVGKGALRRAKNLRERNEYHRRVVAKYGKENILIGMLECSSSDIALELERGIIKCLRAKGVNLSNCTDGGEKGTEVISQETRQKLSAAAKKRGVSEACRAANVAARKGKPLSEEQRRKVAASNTGKVFTEEHRKNISISAKKKGMPKYALEAAHAKVKGRVQSPEERARRSVALTRAWDRKGRKFKKEIDKEAARANSLANLRRDTRPITVDGVYYASSKAASEAVCVSKQSIITALKTGKEVKGHKIEEAKNDN